MNGRLPSSAPPMTPVLPAKFASALEILIYLVVVAGAVVCFILRGISTNQAAILCTLLLSGLIALAWWRFDGGKHPCFLLLCTLMFFQGGRLLSYLMGADIDPLQVDLMTPNPFDLSRDDAGIVLLLLALTGICLYIPCRWGYRRVLPPPDVEVRPYLPYLYVVFYVSLPVQLFKNYKYYQYVEDHGGYATLFVNHAVLTATVPLIVRVIALITFPTFIAIFVFERRKKRLYLATTLYLATASVILLLGLRGAIFALAVTLWYVAGIKSVRRSRLLPVAALLLAIILVGDFVQSLRADPGSISQYTFAPIVFLTSQGNSLEVTEVAVKYRNIFEPYAWSYLGEEFLNAFIASDTTNAFRGKALSVDVPVLLDWRAFAQGNGTGGSYVGEAYVIGGIAGVVLISLLIGLGLHLLHRLSGNALSLFVVANILPDVVMMPRAQLLDWISVLMRSVITVGFLWLGWQLFSFAVPMKAPSRSSGPPPAATIVS
jgi:hypothetical protein